MTRVFVYEYTCAAPPASLEAGGAAALRAEGEAMLRAVLADFACIPSVAAFTIRNCADEEAAFRAAARSADWSLVIAPEFDHILETRCRWVLEEGRRLLAPSPDAVRLCADKLTLFQWWSDRRIRTPATGEWGKNHSIPSDDGKFVIKPRYGAGGHHTFFVNSLADVPGALEDMPMVVQPFIEGRAASVAFLVGESGGIPLRSASQHFLDGTVCRYVGGAVPLPPPLEVRAQRTATAALNGIPGLFGYVGVDIVLGNDGRDWAIEINPRLTTSYVGLRRLAETNLAEAMLFVARGESPELHWRGGSVEFNCAGTVTMRSV